MESLDTLTPRCFMHLFHFLELPIVLHLILRYMKINCFSYYKGTLLQTVVISTRFTAKKINFLIFVVKLMLHC